MDPAEVLAAYDANAAYEEAGSVVMATAFITACRRLIGLRPASGGTDGLNTTWDAKGVRDELARAQQWLAAQNAASGRIGRSFAADLSGCRR
ncbi:hypothetical protein [Alienimonas sp. DA493]|uniref:hypothetical protein n=1 Tax=Alienimonas sp. DA493 TaxID=3373605 RepID=UPI0037543FFD